MKDFHDFRIHYDIEEFPNFVVLFFRNKIGNSCLHFVVIEQFSEYYDGVMIGEIAISVDMVIPFIPQNKPGHNQDTFKDTYVTLLINIYNGIDN